MRPFQGAFSRMSNMVSVRIVNLDTNEEEVLYEREGSECRFAKEFSYENHIIYLRLDFGDIRNGEPMLDAQIKEKTTGKFLETRRHPPWHHTENKYEDQAGRKV
jgi:hypothetical protein